MTDIALIRDALIDATAKEAAKIAERFHETLDPADAFGSAQHFGKLIADAIRDQLLVKPDGPR